MSRNLRWDYERENMRMQEERQRREWRAAEEAERFRRARVERAAAERRRLNRLTRESDRYEMMRRGFAILSGGKQLSARQMAAELRRESLYDVNGMLR